MAIKARLRVSSRRSLRGVVLTDLAKKLPRRPLAKAREARFVDEGGVVASFLAKSVSTTPRNERLDSRS